jgi:hypothetical protein
MWREARPRNPARRRTWERSIPIGWAGAVLVAALLALAACGAAPPDAATLLKNAQVKFDQTKSFHFVLNASHLGASDALGVTYAVGDVQRPDRLKATANANVGGFALSVRLIVIGQQQWFDPGIGTYQPTTQFGSFLTIFDAQQGVGAVLIHMQQPSTPQDAMSGNTPCWKVSGKVDTSLLAAIVGSSTLPQGTTVQTSVCIGKSDNALYSVTLAGAVTQSDTAQTSRSFTLSNFDQPVDIEPPVSPTATP